MTFSDFQAKVRALLYLDGDNPFTNHQQLIAQSERAALIQLQQLIPSFKENHETIFGPDDLTENCFAHTGTLDPGQKITSIWHVSAVDEDEEEEDQECSRKRTRIETRVPWAERQKMISGQIREVETPTIAINPQATAFVFAPKLETDETLCIYHDGLKTDFDENEQVPFTEEAVEVVANYINAQCARKSVEKLSLYESYMESYRSGRTMLHLAEKERRTL